MDTPAQQGMGGVAFTVGDAIPQPGSGARLATDPPVSLLGHVIARLKADFAAIELHVQERGSTPELLREVVTAHSATQAIGTGSQSKDQLVAS